MIRTLLVSAVSALALAACSSTPAPDRTAVAVDSTSAAEPQATAFEMAMQTVEDLVAAGNTQAALDRLTQLLGNPALNREEYAEIVYRRGEIRFGPGGYDTTGAIEDFEEVIDTYPDTEWHTAAVPMLDSARAKATALHAQLGQPETTRLQKFDFLMELGMHQEAIDLMIANNLTPDNAALVAMYDIGYLCEDDALTGRGYQAVEADGTPRTLHFCDFGK
ncbi:hypothetical protein [Hyphomonas johnsonii]|uniref:Putative lipoprotein n=1 Tax=Hyphomonas johnsonii MHS-2 TaxID=1280950 RepID=A0A059FG71_9PROT|nr:hypothetical protein [Hyphomonas johnsonii]KCZ89508.1 putative lipoprotein [Hyphomonas johnsonii MHS-2]